MAPYRAPSLAMQVVCPRCSGIALVRRTIGHVCVDECPRCTGVFVANDALDAILDDLGLYEAVRAAYPPGPRDRHGGGPFYVRCPRCADLMNRRLFAPRARVIVDVCRGHGTWFDSRELPAIVEFVERGGLDEARQEVAARKAAARAQVAVWTATAPTKRGGLLADILLGLLDWRR